MSWTDSFFAIFGLKPVVNINPDLKLGDAGANALAAAKRSFESDIFDPKRDDHSIRAEISRRAIETMMRAVGWTWEIPYTGDGQCEWCGIATGSWWVQAGLKPEIAKTWFASTYRLVKYARYQPFDEKHKNPRPEKGPHRMIMDLSESSNAAALPWQPRAGDVVIMGPGRDQHIEIWDHLEGNVAHTIGGNAGGTGPDGKHRQGVVRAKRAIGIRGMRELSTTWHIRHVIRVAPGDLRALE